jgi:hypothetical protein
MKANSQAMRGRSMNKLKLCIVVLGHSNKLFNIKKIKTWKSDIFEVKSIQKVENLPINNIGDSYLNQRYYPEQFQSILVCPTDCDIVIGVMAYQFFDNFYLHLIKEKCAVVSLFGISEILARKNISMENFILKQFYEICTLIHAIPNLSQEKDAYDFIHLDTRGCLFDMNGDTQDIIYNTEKPKICDECMGNLQRRQIEENIIIKIKKEMKRIKKQKVLEIELFVRKYPLLSLFVWGVVAISLNILASFLWEMIRAK